MKSVRNPAFHLSVAAREAGKLRAGRTTTFLEEGLANMFSKAPESEELRAGGHVVSVTATQLLCPRRWKTTMDNTQMRSLLYSNKTLSAETPNWPGMGWVWGTDLPLAAVGC